LRYIFHHDRLIGLELIGDVSPGSTTARLA